MLTAQRGPLVKAIAVFVVLIVLSPSSHQQVIKGSGSTSGSQFSRTQPSYAQAPLGKVDANLTTGRAGLTLPDPEAGKESLLRAPEIVAGAIQPRMAAGTFVHLTTIDVQGHSRFSDDDLAEVTSDYVDRDVSTSGLLELRDRLTRYYADRGHVNSRAIIPDQNVTHGRLIIHVAEDRLSEIVMNDRTRLNSAPLKGRVRYRLDTDLKLGIPNDRIEPMQHDPAIDWLDAMLKPRLGQDRSRLARHVHTVQPSSMDLDFTNDRSPTAGSEQGDAELILVDLTGQNDLVLFAFGPSQGRHGHRIDAVKFLVVRNVSSNASSNAAASKIAEGQLAELGIERRVYVLSFDLSTPFVRTAKRALRPAAFAKFKGSETFPLGEPVSLAKGLRKSKHRIPLSRPKQGYQRQEREQVIVLAGARRPSVDDFGTSHRASRIAGGQPPLNSALLAERIGVGNSDTADGNRQPAFVFDDGWILANPLRIHVGRLSFSGVGEKPDDGVISLAPFIDTGRDWNNEASEGPTNNALSVGAGIGWQINSQTDLRFGVDLPLVGSDVPGGGDRQDLGFQFRLATELNK